MNVNEVIKDFIAKNQDRTVTEVYKYGDYYLIIAPHKDIEGIDYSDPQFVYYAKTKKFTPFIPSEDLSLYQKLVKNKIYSKE